MKLLFPMIFEPENLVLDVDGTPITIVIDLLHVDVNCYEKLKVYCIDVSYKLEKYAIFANAKKIFERQNNYHWSGSV